MQETMKSLEETVPGPKHLGLLEAANVEIKTTMVENGKLKDEIKELKSDLNTIRSSYNQMEGEKEISLSDYDEARATHGLEVEKYKDEIKALQEKLERCKERMSVQWKKREHSLLNQLTTRNLLLR